MLDRTRDSNGDVQLGRDHLARLSNLERVVGVAGIDGGARRSDRGAEAVGERDDGRVELLLRFRPSSTRDDAGCGAEVGSLRLCQLFRNPLGLL